MAPGYSTRSPRVVPTRYLRLLISLRFTWARRLPGLVLGFAAVTIGLPNSERNAP